MWNQYVYIDPEYGKIKEHLLFYLPYLKHKSTFYICSRLFQLVSGRNRPNKRCILYLFYFQVIHECELKFQCFAAHCGQFQLLTCHSNWISMKSYSFIFRRCKIVCRTNCKKSLSALIRYNWKLLEQLINISLRRYHWLYI